MSSSSMNPFGVGASQAALETRDAMCRCCRLAFRYETVPSAQNRVHCDRCMDHYPITDEPLGRKVARLSEHEPRLHTFVEQAREVATNAHQAAEEGRAQTAAALQSRDRYRAQIHAIEVIHHELSSGSCACGQPRCRTLRALYDAR